MLPESGHQTPPPVRSGRFGCRARCERAPSRLSVVWLGTIRGRVPATRRRPVALGTINLRSASVFAQTGERFVVVPLHSIATGMCRKTNWLFMWRAYLIYVGRTQLHDALPSRQLSFALRVLNLLHRTLVTVERSGSPLSRTSLLVHHSEGSIVKMRNRPRRDGSTCRSSARECRIRRRTY